jgi:hypothetical protein
MARARKRTQPTRPEADLMVNSTPEATYSSTASAAPVKDLEAAALASYWQWNADAGPDERDALEAFAAQDDKNLVAG